MDVKKKDGSISIIEDIKINSKKNEKTFRGGKVNEELIKKSFFDV